MYIQYQAPSPKQGQCEHVAREVGNPLVAAGFAKEVPAPLPATIVEFGVLKGGLDTTPVALFCKCSTCGRTDHYLGGADAKSIADTFLARLCIHAKRLSVPEDVLARYKRERRHEPFGWSGGVPGLNGKAGQQGQ